MEPDRFKESFKYFKSKDPPPDLSFVIEIEGDKNKEVSSVFIQIHYLKE